MRWAAFIALFFIAATLALARSLHTVKSGETLDSIAKMHGVTIASIVATNHLDDPDSLSVGEELIIPDSAATIAKSRFTLPPDLRRQLDNIKVTSGKWRWIVVHHSATTSGNVAGMDAYHRYVRHMENGLAYHFVIGNGRGMGDGQIAIGNRWKKQIKGGHLASPALNEIAIGICLVGNFNKERPTKKQLQSLYALINYLESRCQRGSGAVKLHRQINTKPTECPGKLFPAKDLMNNV